MTLFFPQFLLPFDKVCQLYALVLQSSMRGNVEMAINKLVFLVLALGQTFMGIDPVLVAVMNRVRNLGIVDPTYWTWHFLQLIRFTTLQELQSKL